MKKNLLLLTLFIGLWGSALAQYVANDRAEKHQSELNGDPLYLKSKKSNDPFTNKKVKENGTVFIVNDMYFEVTNEETLEVDIVAKEFPDAYSDNVVIPDEVVNEGKTYRVTAVGDRAFADCYGLSNITFGANIKEIKEKAFAYCEKLTSLVIPDNVEKIGELAFMYCIRVTQMEIGKGLISIDKDAFFDMYMLKKFIVSAENPAFCDVEGVLLNKDKTLLFYRPANNPDESYTLPETVKRIASNAFIYSDLLLEINLPDVLETIEEGAFYHCRKLTGLHLSSALKEIGSYVFSGTWALSFVTVPETNTHYSSEDNVLFNKDKTTLCLYPMAREGETYSAPSTLTAIGDYAFDGIKKLKIITFPDGLQTIGVSAFTGSEQLVELVFGNSLTHIGRRAFSHGKKLQSLTFGNALREVGEEVLYYTQSINNVSVGAIVPPATDPYAFDGDDVANCTLEVPVNSLSAYEAHSSWGKFGTIVGSTNSILPAGMTDKLLCKYQNENLYIELPQLGNITIYNLLGQTVYNIQNVITVNLPIKKGVYIVKTDNQTMKIGF